MAVIFLGLTGCSRLSSPHLESVTERIGIGYRLDVQQGNVLTKEMLGQLRPGMDKKKVTFIMGTPAVKDTFHNNRWDYIYTYQKGREVPKRRHIALFFKDDKLVSLAGDITPADGPMAVDVRKDMTVEVPPAPKPGLVDRAVAAIPFVGDKPHKNAKGDKDPDEALIVRLPSAPVVVEAPSEDLPPPPGGEPAKTPPATADNPNAPGVPGTASAVSGTVKTANNTNDNPRRGFFGRLFNRDKTKPALEENTDQ